MMRAQRRQFVALTRRALVALVLCAVASQAHAQQPAPAPGPSTVKVVAGALMVVAGAAIIPVMAQPGESVAVSVPGVDGVRAGVRVEAGTSWPGVGVGAGLATGGVILLWQGLRSHRAPTTAPSASVGVRVARRGAAIDLRRRW